MKILLPSPTRRVISWVGWVTVLLVATTVWWAPLAAAVTYSGVVLSTPLTTSTSPLVVDNCTVAVSVIVDVSVMNTNAGAGTTPLQVLFNRSTVASTYYLQIKGFTTAAAADSATRPFFATITYNTFVNGLIALNNHFPAGSLIDVRHNACNQIADTVVTTATGHKHFFGIVGVGLRRSSKLLIEQNVIVVSFSSGASIQCMMISGAFFADKESVWSLSNNNITVANDAMDALGMYIYASSATGTVSDLSSFVYANNTVMVSSSRIAALFLSQSLPQLYSNGSSFDIYNNKVTIKGGTGKNCGFVLDYWASGAVMTVTKNSLIRISNNQITMSSSGGPIDGISLGKTELTLGSELSVSDNLFLMPQISGTVIGIEFKLDITLSSGNININANRMIACSNALGLGYVTPGHSFGVSSGGQFLFTRNSVERGSSCSAAGVFPLLSGPVVPSGTGVFYLCPWNRYGNTMAFNPKKHYTTAMISSYAAVTDKCLTPTESISASLNKTHSKTAPHTQTAPHTSSHAATITLPQTKSPKHSATYMASDTMSLVVTLPHHSISPQGTHSQLRTVSVTSPPTTSPIKTISPQGTHSQFRTVSVVSPPTTSPIKTISHNRDTRSMVVTSGEHSDSFDVSPTPRDEMKATPTTSNTPSRSQVVSLTKTPAATLPLPPPVAGVIAQLPLFATVTVAEEAVRGGFATVISNLNLTVIRQIVAARNYTLPISQLSPVIASPQQVVGNPEGFFAHLPSVVVTVLNDTCAEVTFSSLPAYTIAANEGLQLFTTIHLLYAGQHSNGHDGFDQALLVGTIVVEANVPAYPAPTVGVVVGVAVGGAAAGAASELQGLGVLALLGCSEPLTSSNLGSYRILSPVAILDSYAGVILGNVILAVAVGVVQGCVVVGLKCFGRVQRLISIMATARFPSLLVAASVLFHTGTAFASAQLVSQPHRFETWEVVVGALGFVYSLLLPAVLSAYPYLRVGRAYQVYDDVPQWLTSRNLPQFLAHVLPQGAIFSTETRTAYGRCVSGIRAPAGQVWWTSLPTWVGTVFLVAGLFHPSSVPLCQALLICVGVVLVGMAVAILRYRPHRSTLDAILVSISTVCLGAVAFTMSAALSTKSSSSTSTVVLAFAVAMGLVALLRLSIMLLTFWFDAKMQAESVTLSTGWTHVPHDSHKVTHQFTTTDESLVSLVTLAGQRSVADDVETQSNQQLSSATLVLESIDSDPSDSAKVFAPPATKRSASSLTSSSSTSSLSQTDATPPGDGGEEIILQDSTSTASTVGTPSSSDL